MDWELKLICNLSSRWHLKGLVNTSCDAFCVVAAWDWFGDTFFVFFLTCEGLVYICFDEFSVDVGVRLFGQHMLK